MTGLSDSLASIARYRRQMKQAMDGSAHFMGPGSAGPQAGALVETSDFGANPGNLRMFSHVPAGLPAGAPLVVVLHGCGQNAAGYDKGTGWSALAARFGFAVLLPEQGRANNQQGCFNWFVPEDIARGMGEAASVRAMIQQMATSHGLDPRRIFVTGLSAGGAFANVMLATYPEVFAGGAIIAGLPFGAAVNTQSALGLMFQGQAHGDRDWGDRIRAATSHRGPWPRISVWHGGADSTVIPANGQAIVRQWLDVHGLTAATPRAEPWGPAEHKIWRHGDGRVAVESYTLPHLAHAVPISSQDADPDQRCGVAGPFITETGISSSYLIAQGWGLAGPIRPAPPGKPSGTTAGSGVAGMIHKALLAAGLAKS